MALNKVLTVDTRRIIETFLDSKEIRRFLDIQIVFGGINVSNLDDIEIPDNVKEFTEFLQVGVEIEAESAVALSIPRIRYRQLGELAFVVRTDPRDGQGRTNEIMSKLSRLFTSNDITSEEDGASIYFSDMTILSQDIDEDGNYFETIISFDYTVDYVRDRKVI